MPEVSKINYFRCILMNELKNKIKTINPRQKNDQTPTYILNLSKIETSRLGKINKDSFFCYKLRVAELSKGLAYV